jgi:hypothetical protein
MRDAKREQWPYGLGTIEQWEARDDSHSAAKEAKEISRRIFLLPLDDSTAAEYVAAQTAKNDDAIDPPPSDTHLAGQHTPLAELVRDILATGGRIGWGDDGAPWRSDNAGAMLAADALDQTRNGDAAAAWEEIHALWILARSVAAEPYGAEMGLEMKRAANAVARKLPAPAPAWSAELSTLEPRRDTAAIIQQNVASRVRSETKLPGPLVLFRPISDWIESSNLRRSRASAESMTKSPRCRMSTADDVLNSNEIYRAVRIEAEAEATAKVLALKNERARLGRWPPALADAASRCGDNRWIYSAGPNGSSMTLRMSWEVAAEPDKKNAPALKFDY